MYHLFTRPLLMDPENLTHHAVLSATVNATVNGTVAEADSDGLTHSIFFKLRVAVLLIIIIMAVLGNMLVIVSVMRHR